MKILYTILIICLFYSTSLATDYYVSPDGTETWPNCTTSSNPCLASNTSKDFLGAVAGDTVYFLDGTYSGLTWNKASYKIPAWNPSNSGTVGNPIVFKSINHLGAELVGLKVDTITDPTIHCYGSVPMIGAYDRDYITWDGFKLTAIDQSDSSPVMAAVYNYGDSSTNIGNKIINNEIVGVTHSLGGSCNYEGIRIEVASDTEIANNYIHGFVEASDSHNTSGTKSYNTNNTTYSNNYFYSNTVGIYIKGNGNPNSFIYNNDISDSVTGIFYAVKSASSEGISIHNNVIRDSALSAIGDDYDSGTVTNGYTAHNMTVYNNTIYNGGLGSSPVIILTHITDPSLGAKVYNNIFSSSNGNIDISTRANVLPAEIDHNIYYTAISIEISRYASSRSYTTLGGWQASGELYAAVDVGCGSSQNPGCGSLVQDPGFANTSGTLSTLADFEVTNTLGRDNGLLGADVSLVGIQGEVKYYSYGYRTQ